MKLIIAILSSFGIIGSGFGYTIGRSTFEVIDSFMKNIMLPIINHLFGKNISKSTIEIGKIKFKIGPVIDSLINFILVLSFIIFILRYVFKDLVEAVIQHQDQYTKKTSDLLQDMSTWKLPL